MNRRQKQLFVEVATVLLVTAIAVVAMINLKDWINRSEAMRAMQQLGQRMLDYRKTSGFLPPESYVNDVKDKVEGSVRLGKIHYRARWIDLNSDPNEILAYSGKNYRASLLSDGFVVLFLDGKVRWIHGDKFKSILAQQQNPLEIEMTQE